MPTSFQQLSGITLLLMDGVFIDPGVEQSLTFVELPLIDPTDVERLLVRIARRVLRYAQRFSDEVADEDLDSEQAGLANSQR